jgi:hypothetical protein
VDSLTSSSRPHSGGLWRRRILWEAHEVTPPDIRDIEIFLRPGPGSNNLIEAYILGVNG